MRIVVFGGSGFLGSHIADTLTNMGHRVLIFDKIKSPYLKEGQISIIGDIEDYKKVYDSIEGCDVVYNYAGIADIGDAKEKPIDVVRSNILGNTILLDACKKQNIKRYIFASTLYVYSKAGSFYRSSKQACELLIDNYHEIYGIDFTIIRYGSLYGPRAGSGNWINKTLIDAITKKLIIRHGDGEELRDYIHVIDAARLSVNVLEAEYANQHVIITGNQQIRVKDLMMMIREMLNNDVEIGFEPINSSEHYKITPFNFSPKLAKRMQSNYYIDLGQGIFELLGEIYKGNLRHRKHNGIYVKD